MEMNRKSIIARHSLEEIKAMRARGEDQTRADAPEADSLGENFWKDAKVVMPGAKKAVNIRVDADVLDWFKSQGSGYLTRMNAVLRTYYEAKRARPTPGNERKRSSR
jgi:uncharacterized protein (DUF4415 family)